MTSIDLREKTAIVTGGSRGIGRAVCRKLAAAGARVALGHRSNEAAAREVVAELQALGAESIAVAGDAGRKETSEQLFERTRDALGPVDIVVGNAAIWKRAPIAEMSEEEWDETIGTNLKSVYFLCHFAARDMLARGRGRIILIGSTAGQQGEADYCHYAASKGAIQAMTKSLAAELGPAGIRVNCVAPGWVETDMTSDVFSDPDFKKRAEREAPLRKIASADQVADAVLFLASDLSSHIQGEILNVNGGSLLCG